MTSPEGIDDLVREATARDFVADAFQRCKFIGYHESAMPLLEKAGIASALDKGTVALPEDMNVSAFVEELGKLRVWDSEPSLPLGGASPKGA